MAILFVSGVNDLSVIGISPDDDGQPRYRIDGNAPVYPQIPLGDGVALSFLIFGKGVRQHSVAFADPPSLVFNQIADADTHQGALQRCIELCDQLDTTVINHPVRVLKTRRDLVASALQGISGVVVPRTLRFQPDSPDAVFSRADAEGYEFPLIVRQAGERGDRGTVRLNSPTDHALLHALPFDGRFYYVTEFIDCKDDRGYYSKQRLAMIDGAPSLQFSVYDRQWRVRAGSRSGTIQREGREAVNARETRLENEVVPRVAPACEEIARRLGLEYFGIDCHMGEDGRLIVFEASANLNILIGRSQQPGDRKPAVYDRVYRMLRKYSGEEPI